MADIYAEKMVRTTGERQRLNEQFDLMTSNIGYLIHPRIATTLPSGPQVADVGTGSGCFLYLMQEIFPDANLDGYDISSALYPATTPANITLRIMDIKQPVPEELRGKYDLVHARLLVVAMQPDEWTPVVRNTAQLLKPGGWIQWEECSFSEAAYLRGASLESSPIEMVTKFSRMWIKEMCERFSCGWSTLPTNMREAGLTSIESDRVACDRLPETRKKIAMNAMTVIFSWQRMLATKGLPGALSLDELEQSEKRAYEEIELGAYVKYDIHVACGQKPLK